MILLSDLPTDANGITQGAWRLIHADPTYCGSVGMVDFIDGVGQRPIAGRQLRFAVAECGSFLFIEPWGALPPGWELPELVNATVSEEELAKLPLAPWRAKAAGAMMPLVDELLKLAGEGGPEDFARSMAAVPEIPDAELVGVRTEYSALASRLRADGYVEIPKALEGAIALLDERIAKLPTSGAGVPFIGSPEAADELLGAGSAASEVAKDLLAPQPGPKPKSLAEQIDAIRSKKDAVAFGAAHGVTGLSEDTKLAELKAHLVSSLVPHEPQAEGPKPS